MRKYIIFMADLGQPFWQNRKLQHTQALTRILAEYSDSSDSPIPEPGYRPTEFVRVENAVNESHGYSTHYKAGDWVVDRVDQHPSEIAGSEYDLIALCWCKYEPIATHLKEMPERTSFITGTEEELTTI